MRALGLLAAILVCGCRPWCATPPALWTAASYGPEADAVSETDAFIAAQAALGRDRPRAELDAAARTLGAADASELAAIEVRSCLGRGERARFAAARGLSAATADAYLQERFGVRLCPE